MIELLTAIFTQTLTFLPLAVGISISYNILRATDMTLDGSFVLGAGVFAKLVVIGYSPLMAAIAAIIAGAGAGMMVSAIQRGGKVDALLAGILATFILTSGNLLVMGRPNINLLNQHTLFSAAFLQSDLMGWMQVGIYALGLCVAAIVIMQSRLGLLLRALGDNPKLLQQQGHRIELYRSLGFALTNALAAASGCLTAQTVGYADISMGFGMTLTGVGAIILGGQILQMVLRKSLIRSYLEFTACLVGVLGYYFAINCLLRFAINPLYIKMILGLILIFFLRAAVRPQHAEMK
jgi:putative ABC transport system permease protein